MNDENVSLIGLAMFKPSQNKYKDGHVYISALVSNKELIALDVRYFAEEGNELAPTRNGFRIPADSLDHCVRTLLNNPLELDDICHQTKTREIHVRYVSDKYGEAIDIRYYKKSKKYTGWEKRGLRFRVQDFKEFQRLLGAINFSDENLSNIFNLFSGKEIVDPKQRWKTEPTGDDDKNKFRKGSLEPKSKSYINEALLEILG